MMSPRPSSHVPFVARAKRQTTVFLAAVLTTAAVSISGSPAASANAPIVSGGYSLQTIAYEGFDYPALSSLDTQNGGTGWVGAWTEPFGGDSPLGVQSQGLTYPGLTVEGRATQYFGGRPLNSNARSLPRVHSGIVYVQFLVNLLGGFNNGAPNLRFVDSTLATQTGAIGSNNTGNNAAILSPGLTLVDDSGVSINTGIDTLLVVRIDYDAQTTDLWVNPDLSTFDYANPPASNASAAALAPTFDKVNLLNRSAGSYDEIRVMQLLPPTPPPPPTPATPPLNVTAESGNGRAFVSWSPPASSGSFAITNYLVTANPGGRTCLTTTTSCTVTRLSNGVEYTFSVQALTGAGWSLRSAASNAVTPIAQRIQMSLRETRVRDRPGILVTGTTTGLAPGTRLQAWIRFQGDKEFQPARAIINVNEDGQYSWQRRLSRSAVIYLATEDFSVIGPRVVVESR